MKTYRIIKINSPAGERLIDHSLTEMGAFKWAERNLNRDGFSVYHFNTPDDFLMTRGSRLPRSFKPGYAYENDGGFTFGCSLSELFSGDYRLQQE